MAQIFKKIQKLNFYLSAIFRKQNMSESYGAYEPEIVLLAKALYSCCSFLVSLHDEINLLANNHKLKIDSF